MTDEELVRAFESTDLPAEQFPHREHVRVAWWYLRQHPIGEAIVRFSAALRRFAVAKAVPDLYHETITIAFLLVIAERLGQDDARALEWTTFATRHADLLTWKPSVLSRYYTDDLLFSDRAKRGFVMPYR